jgi:ADP-ribose pyrophosphatase YjhB (NUDIX family)
MNPKVRATTVLIEKGCILLVEQQVTESLDRKWSLPGGTLEAGETLEACVVRETREETGLDVALDKLLYVCDRIVDDRHVVHITFAVKRLGGDLQLGAEPELGASPIKSVKMVPLAFLGEYGFSQRFCELAMAGFPEGGTYQGLVTHIGL